MGEFRDTDEINQYLDGRYIGASEAAWRLYSFNLHEESHTVYRLPIHLPGEHSISYSTDTSIHTILEQEHTTKLLESIVIKIRMKQRNLLTQISHTITLGMLSPKNGQKDQERQAQYPGFIKFLLRM